MTTTIIYIGYDYLLKEAHYNPNNITTIDFTLVTDEAAPSYHIHYLADQDCYCLHHGNLDRKSRFATLEELINATIFGQQSLKMMWNEVHIQAISGLTVKQWLSSKNHGVQPLVWEDDDALYINFIVIDGFIDDDQCRTCSMLKCYADKFDAYFCPYCDAWLEINCGHPSCEFCRDRPEKPSILWK